MPDTVVLLTEEALSADDASRLVALHSAGGSGEDSAVRVTYRVLVPADVKRNLLADVLDHLTLFELREALDAVRGEDDPTRAEASAMLDASVAALGAAGAQADGRVVEADPVQALRDEVAGRADVREAVIVTRPHAVEDTFHTDWASKARDTLGLPVLHVYAGSSFLG